MIWKILEIEQTKDEECIRDAYRRKLRTVNPEDDQEGFKELRRAYEEALVYASQPEDATCDNAENPVYKGKRTEVDDWIDRVDRIYQDVKKRCDKELWNSILNDSICDNLDLEIEASYKLMVYFMSHSYMPQAIWQLIDKRFRYQDNLEQLKEKFPENFLDYIIWQMNHPNFIDFDLFDGKTDSKIDDYISTLYEEKNASDDGDLEKAARLIKELKRYEVYHPFTEVEEARFFIRQAMVEKQAADQQEKKEETDKRDEESWKEKLEKALSIMEDLDFEYSDNPYVERTYAEALYANGAYEKAKEIYEALAEKDEMNYIAALGKAKCIFKLGNIEAAKELVEDILEERVQEFESMQLLDEINVEIAKKYEKLVFGEYVWDGEQVDHLPSDVKKRIYDGSDEEREYVFKLGWCYYQQRKFTRGIHLLDLMKEAEDYDYINLRCRLYLADEMYELAYPLSEKWLKLIEESEEDGSKEMQKRKNRLSLALFSVGVCIWEKDFDGAVSYINRAIEKESNRLVRLSYMEQLARFYLSAKMYQHCVDICNCILEEDKGFYPAYVHRQRANYELKKAKEVVDDYYICKELYPDYSVPYVLAAEVFMAFEQYDDVENILKDGEEAGLKSDGLELYRIKCLHYKEFSVEHVKKALEQIDALIERVDSRSKEESTDLEDVSELYREKAILYWDLDKNEEALKIVEDYLKEHPTADGLLQLKVDILGREKKYIEAIETCKKLVTLNPKNLQYLLKLGNCYERAENPDKAIACYLEILEKNDQYVPAVRRLMYVYSYLSNERRDLELSKKGIEYATQLITLTKNAEGYVERGNLYIDLYELEQAVEDCKEAIRLDSEAYYAYNNLGCALLKLRRIEEAILPLEKVIAMNPDKDHLPYLNLAECYLLKKEYDKAIHAYKEVLRLRPNAMNIEKDIAKIYVMQKEYGKAIAFYEKKIAEVQARVKQGNVLDKIKFYLVPNPDKEKRLLMDLYHELAEVYRQAGNIELADSYYRKIFNREMFYKQSTASMIEAAAEFYRDQGELKRAYEILKYGDGTHLVAEERGRYAQNHLMFVKATVLFEMGRMRAAKQSAITVINTLKAHYGGEEKMLSDSRYLLARLYDLGIMNVCAGRLEEAKVYFEKMKQNNLCVICQTCGCFEYYFGMGLIAELEGNLEQAKSMYEHAIAIKGDYPCAKRHLRLLDEQKER